MDDTKPAIYDVVMYEDTSGNDTAPETDRSFKSLFSTSPDQTTNFLLKCYIWGETKTSKRGQEK